MRGFWPGTRIPTEVAETPQSIDDVEVLGRRLKSVSGSVSAK